MPFCNHQRMLECHRKLATILDLAVSKRTNQNHYERGEECIAENKALIFG